MMWESERSLIPPELIVVGEISKKALSRFQNLVYLRLEQN